MMLIESGMGWHRSIMKQPDEECDRAWDVDERIDTVDPEQECGVLQEEGLNLEFMEDMQTLFQSDDLEGMCARDFDSAGGHGDGGEGAAELVDLDDGEEC